MIRAAVIEDTCTYRGARLTTFEVVCHRFVLAEFNTHRVFSRNSASSRAIPVAKMLGRVMDDPAWPEVWASEQKGMQGGPPLDGTDLFEAQRLFHDIHEYTTRRVGSYLQHHPLDSEGQRRLHKSLINRLMEPFMWHTIIVTSAEWENFTIQRCSPQAMPEMRLVAEAMEEAYHASKPREIYVGDWHLPYVQGEDLGAIYGRDGSTPLVQRIEGTIVPEAVEYAKKISAARCARVSYLTHDGKRDIREDIRMFDETLMTADPKHWSPLEHVATPIDPDGGGRSVSGLEWQRIQQRINSGEWVCNPGDGGLHIQAAVPDSWLDIVVPGNFAPDWLQLRHTMAAAA